MYKKRFLLFPLLCTMCFCSYAGIIQHNSGMYGFVNEKGDTLSLQAHYIWPFSDGLARILRIYKVGLRCIPLYGFINLDGDEVVTTKYDYATDFKNGFAVVGERENCLYESAWWKGPIRMLYKYIDKSGNNWRQKFDFASNLSDSGKAVIGILNGHFHPFCHPEDFTCEFQYITKEQIIKDSIGPYLYWYATEYKNGKAIVADKHEFRDESYFRGLKKYCIDLNGDSLASQCIDSVKYTSEYYCYFRSMFKWIFPHLKMSMYKIMDVEGDILLHDTLRNINVRPFLMDTIVLETPLSSPITRIYSHGLVGLSDGKSSITPQFDYISVPDYSISCGRCIVCNDEKYGVISLNGTYIVKPKYQYIDTYYRGYAIVKDLSGYGLIDSIGNVVVPCKYEKIEYILTDNSTNVFFRVNMNNKTGILSCNGRVIADFDYDSIGKNWYGLIAVKKNGQWGFLNRNLELQIPFQYKEVKQAFYNGFAIVVSNSGKEMTIDENGIETSKVIPEIDYSIRRLNAIYQ